MVTQNHGLIEGVTLFGLPVGHWNTLEARCGCGAVSCSLNTCMVGTFLKMTVRSRDLMSQIRGLWLSCDLIPKSSGRGSAHRSLYLRGDVWPSVYSCSERSQRRQREKLAVDPALEIQTSGPASHPAVISKQSGAWGNSSAVLEGLALFPMMCSFKDTEFIYLPKRPGCYSCWLRLKQGKKSTTHASF